MTGEVLGFWAVALVLLAASLGVVLARNLFHAVLYLTAFLVATAVEFLLLHSAFLFAVQLLLYAGGVVTIVVFAIMLTARLVGETLTQTNRYIVNGAVVSAAVVGFLLQVPKGGAFPGPAPDPTAAVGHALLGPFALSLILLAVLLVAALIGALYFARADD